MRRFHASAALRYIRCDTSLVPFSNTATGMCSRSRHSNDVACVRRCSSWQPLAAASNPAVVRLATTTSVENSGLLAEVLPAFERQSQIKVDVLAVGSGQALNLLKRGEVAVGLTHDPRAEAEALASGIITGYRKIMFNDFIVVGPSEDPAGVARASGVADAFARIAATAVRRSFPAATRRARTPANRSCGRWRSAVRPQTACWRPVRAWAARSAWPTSGTPIR